MLRKTGFVVVVGMASVACAWRPAYAADSASQPTRSRQTREAAKAPGRGVEEVVVTSTKSRQRLQKTAAAVTVISGATLTQRGITNLRDAQAEVPAAKFQLEGQTVQVFLRGVGSNLDYGNIDQLVGFNINGVYIPREGTSVPLFDLASLEALPGPQGTLYGRGSLGGALNITLNRPTHEWGASSVMELGNYDLIHFTGVANMPVRSDLAVRIGFDDANHGGYLSDGSDSQRDISGRLDVLYDPTPDFTLNTWGYAVDRLGHPPNLVNKGLDPNTNAYSENAFLHSDPYDTSRLGSLQRFAPFGQAIAQDQTYNNYVFGSQLDYRIDGVTITYIPSYFYLNSINQYWLGGILNDKLDYYSQYTQELRAAGTVGRFKFLVGLYGYDQRGRSNDFLVPIHIRSSDILHNVKQGEAIFGQLTYALTSRLRLIGGGRFSADQRKANGIAGSGEDYFYQHDYTNIDYKVGADYDVTNKILAYANIQTSYQPGTFNEAPNTPTFQNKVKPSHLTAFSAGFKSRFFDDKLQFNDEFFYYLYRDLQIQSYNENIAFNPIINASKVIIPGNQADLVLRPDEADRFNVSVAYNHARAAVFDTPTGSFAGYQTPYASDWNVTAGAQHDFAIPGAGYLRARWDTRFASSFFADYTHHPGTRQDGFDKNDLAVTYFSESGRWTLGMWVRNIGNVATIAAAAFGGIPGPATAYLEDPRTFGARATINY